MNDEVEMRIATNLAKIMALQDVRNTHLVTLYAGKTPETKAGELSDMTVVEAYGKHIAWADVSRISHNEMRHFTRDIVNRVYTFDLYADEQGLKAAIEKSKAVSGRWEEPEIDTTMLEQKGGAV